MLLGDVEVIFETEPTLLGDVGVIFEAMPLKLLLNTFVKSLGTRTLTIPSLIFFSTLSIFFFNSTCFFNPLLNNWLRLLRCKNLAAAFSFSGRSASSSILFCSKLKSLKPSNSSFNFSISSSVFLILSVVSGSGFGSGFSFFFIASIFAFLSSIRCFNQSRFSTSLINSKSCLLFGSNTLSSCLISYVGLASLLSRICPQLSALSAFSICSLKPK